ncbi:MAG: hypothetical protein AAF974_12620, partial [Cyanobacteria bacterium P01_E01_bin.34]
APSAAFVTILSPDYLRSKDCMAELQSFSRAAVRTGGLRLTGGTSRTFKVVRSAVPLERQPRELQTIRDYNCCQLENVEQDTGRPSEPNPVQADNPSTARSTPRPPLSGQECDLSEDIRVLQVIDDLAYDIQKLLVTLAETRDEPLQEGELDANMPAQKIIYLAETSQQLTAIRDDVRRELELAGHWVLPDRPLPRNNGFSEEIQASLALCDLSVHLLDAAAALLPKDASAPLSAPTIAALHRETNRIKTQVKLAADRLKDADFSQILWVPSQQGRDYWEAILDTLPELPEMLLSGVEDLKTAIQTYLERELPPPANEVSSEGESNSLSDRSSKVYVDFDRQDTEDPVLGQIQDWLGERFQVLVPHYSSGEGIGSSEAKLRQADGVLIYYGQGSDVWLKRRLNALRKTCSGRRAPVPRAVYVGQPTTPHKHDLGVTQVSVLHPSEPFSPDVLQLFATRICNSQKG